ncbi:hypothetical protein [Caldilinea sp.]|uniref:hypothetical protein n=2 Tax=Caldilinea sp. TaxID=2293560 RepID=UPI00262DE33C|nr:hypothetical protein [Caldilinea sp.]
MILELAMAGRLRVLDGYDRRPGWRSNIKCKPLLYGLLAQAVKERVCTIRDVETASQLASIEASTLRASQWLHDDRADAFALAALAWEGKAVASSVVVARDPLEEERGGEDGYASGSLDVRTASKSAQCLASVFTAARRKRWRYLHQVKGKRTFVWRISMSPKLKLNAVAIYFLSGVAKLHSFA